MTRSLPLLLMSAGVFLWQCCGTGDVPGDGGKVPSSMAKGAAPMKTSDRPHSNLAVKQSAPEVSNKSKNTANDGKSASRIRSKKEISLENVRKYLRLGFVHAALDTLDSTEIDRTGCDYWVLRTEAFVYLARYNEAVAQSRAGEKYCTGSADRERLLTWRLKAYGHARTWRKVIPLAMNMLREWPRSRETYLWYLEALKRTKKFRELGRVLRKAREVFPNDGDIASFEVVYYFGVGNPEQAIKLAREFASNRQFKGYIRAGWLDFLGKFYARRKMTGRAMEILKECRKRFPEFGCPGTKLLLAPRGGRPGFGRIVRMPRGHRVEKHVKETLK